MISIIIVVNNHYFHHYNGYEPWKPTHGYHAGICIAGGERVSLRDLVYRWAERACLRPEREKSGLLLPRGQIMLAVATVGRLTCSFLHSLATQLH